MCFRRFLLLLVLAFALPLAVHAQGGGGNILLEENQIFRPVVGRNGMVSSADEYSTGVGVEILKSGGNAVDAAVAMAFVEAVTLPRAGNLGGGGFLLVRTPEGRIEALDFRERAPARATRDMYLDASGKPVPKRSTIGYLASGVPGTVAGLAEVHRRYGSRPLRELVEPARRLAAQGFPLSSEVAADFASISEDLGRYRAAAEIFLPGGKPPEPGHVLVQRDLAWTLEQIQAGGADAFYKGEVARRIARDMAANGGLITEADLAAYRPVWRDPVRGTYRGYEIWSMPPPSSGGVHLVQMLNILEGFDLRPLGQNSAATLHRMSEAMRSAYADRAVWLGDPDFVRVPVEYLTSKPYAEELRAAIPPERARPSAEVRPGSPPGYESEDTTHMSIVDRHGGSVALTYTLNFSYGSRVVAAGTGILLNNEMDDFATAPGVPNAFGLVQGERNSVQPGKRPLSSMTPTLVTRDGELVMALGSPGGPRIITTVLQVMVNVLDFGLNAQEAVSRPRIHHQWLPDVLRYESGLSPDTVAILQRLGHKMEGGTATGQCAIVRVLPDGTREGGIDLRRPGAAEGY